MRRHGCAALGAAMLVLASCGGSTSSGDDAESLRGEILVVAASSLTETFTELAGRFESRHPDLDVLTSFASSAAIRAQVESGASADVIATADEATMAMLDALGAIDPPRPFARNKIEIAVERDNPLGIGGLRDLTSGGQVIVACVAGAPCGALADAVVADAGLTLGYDSREPNAKATVQRVALGEADAALVYVTDVRAADVEGVPIESGRRNRYPIAAMSESTNSTAASAFVEFVLSDEARELLIDRGFTAP